MAKRVDSSSDEDQDDDEAEVETEAAADERGLTRSSLYMLVGALAGALAVLLAVALTLSLRVQALRRALPMTRSKLDWDRVLGYKLGAELTNSKGVFGQPS